MKFLPPDGTPLRFMKAPRAIRADYLDTLQKWGALPEVVPVLDVARYLAMLCKQNPAAIATVMKQAIERGELKFWGLGASSDGQEWVENLFRVLNTARIVSAKRGDDEEEIVATLEIEEDGRPHWEAIGITPASAVALLVCRGRKVPKELLEFLSEAARQGAGANAPNIEILRDREGIEATVPEQAPIRRRDLLAPLVEQAQRECQAPTDAPAVFSVLRDWAKRTPPKPPLIGVTEDGRLQWLDSNDKPQELNAKALKKRIQRRAS